MKTLNNYITEWRANTNTVPSIKKIPYLIYKLTTNNKIKIFDDSWPQFKEYKNKVYINNEQIELDNFGWTMEFFDPGEYYVEIKDIDNVTNCYSMFFNCVDLVKVTLFDTSKVEKMDEMFSYCENLKDIPLFDTSKVKNMSAMFYNCKHLRNVPLFNMNKVITTKDMFYGCDNLSEQTKNAWKQYIYF